ncbi:MAG: SseB family protein [Neomegalonema sp.]|nr:SseB family protein [Neomegalonema sp.]
MSPNGENDASASDAPTRIDLAWRAARAGEQDLENGEDAAAAAFVDVVLNELLVCPVWDSEGEPPAADAAQPKLVATEAGDALPLFDSEDRLAAYLDTPSAFIALPGQAFFELAAQHELAITFNPEVAPSAMVFSASTVAAIAELVEANESQAEIDASGAIEARAPSEAPPALLRALGARLAAARELTREGWLFEAVFEDEPPALVLGLVATPGAAPEALRSLSAELSRLGSTLLEPGAALSVALFDEGDAALQRIRSVGFGMALDQAARTA